MTRETLLAKAVLRRKAIEIPEWEVTVTIRELTYPERARYYREAVGNAAIRKAAKKSLAEPEGLEAPPQKQEPEPDPEPEDNRDEVGAFMAAKGRLGALAVCMALIDPETGQRLFRDEDFDTVLGFSPDILDRLHLEIARMSGIGEHGEQDVEQDSLRTLNDAPSSGSPSPSEGHPASSPAS